MEELRLREESIPRTCPFDLGLWFFLLVTLSPACVSLWWNDAVEEMEERDDEEEVSSSSYPYPYP